MGRVRRRPPRPLPGARLSRFSDIIERQLRFFQEDYADLIARCDAAERAYDRAGRDEAEERYGDFVDAVAAGAEILAEIRDGYARTLRDGIRETYEQAFARAVAKRLPRFALELESH